MKMICRGVCIVGLVILAGCASTKSAGHSTATAPTVTTTSQPSATSSTTTTPSTPTSLPPTRAPTPAPVYIAFVGNCALSADNGIGNGSDVDCTDPTSNGKFYVNIEDLTGSNAIFRVRVSYNWIIQQNTKDQALLQSLQGHWSGTLAFQSHGAVLASNNGLRDNTDSDVAFTVATSSCSSPHDFTATLTSFAHAGAITYYFHQTNTITLACAPPPSLSDVQVQTLITNDVNTNSPSRLGQQEYVDSFDKLTLLHGLYTDSNGYSKGYCAAVTYGSNPPPATGTTSTRLAYTLSFNPDQSNAVWTANYGYNFSDTC